MSDNWLNIPRIVYALTLATQLIAFTRFGWYQKVPLFTLLQIAAISQTALHFSNADPDNSWWYHWAFALLLLRLACAVEIASAWTERMRWPNRQSMILALGVLATMLIIAAWSEETASPNPAMAEILWKANGALILGLAMCRVVLRAFGERLDGDVQAHGYLFMALMANQVVGIWMGNWVGTTGSGWRWIMGGSYFVAGCVQAGWIYVIVPESFRRKLFMGTTTPPVVAKEGLSAHPERAVGLEAVFSWMMRGNARKCEEPQARQGSAR